MMKRYAATFALLVLGLTLLMPASAGAQGGPGNADLLVLQTVMTEGEDSAQLKVYLALRDRNGDQLQDENTSLNNQGSFTLGGERVDAEIKLASDPIKIALVIDASGSMNAREKQGPPLINQVREAALQMIELAPANAEFVVFSFADQVQRQNEGFLRRSDQADLAKDAIRTFKIKPPNKGDTCLYDAASQALDALIAAKPAPTERLSVILFTDGKDREAGGALCGSSTGAPEVIRKALSSGNVPIPIYTIGVCANDRAPADDIAKRCSNVNSAELSTLAKETRAFPAIGPRGQLNELFGKIMRGLSRQWVAQATICPTEGSNTALLEVAYGDAMLSKAVPFTAARTCLPPSTFEFGSQVYVAATDSYTVPMALGSPQRVKQLTVGLFDSAEGGTQVAPPLTFDTPPAQLVFALPSTGMAAGREYFLRASAQGRDGKPLRGVNGSPIVALTKFTYNPTLDFQISGIEPDWKNEQLVVAIKVSGAGGRVLTFDGELRDPKTGQSESLATAVPQEGKLYVAMPPMLRQIAESRDFALTLSLTAGGVSLIRSYNRQFTPLSKETPPLNGLLIGLLAALVFGAAGAFWLVRKRAQAPAIPKPYSDMTVIRPTAPAHRPSTKPKAEPPAAAVGATEPQPEQTRTVLATERPRRLRLRVVQTPKPGIALEQTISSFPFVVGRTSGDLVFANDAKLSARHLQIDVDGESFRLTDLESSNGTWVGEQRLGKGASKTFGEQATVRLGPDTTLELEPEGR